MEQASWLVANAEQIGVVFLLIVGLWYIHNELNGFKKLHVQELSEMRSAQAEMRKAHREEREATNAYMKKALEDIVHEIKIANSERADIKHLLGGVKDFQIMVSHSLNTYDKILSQILTILNATKSGEVIEFPKFHEDKSSSFPTCSIPRAEERERVRSRERMREYDRDN